MIRQKTFLAAAGVVFSFSAAVASASTDVPAAEDAQRLTVQDRSQLRLKVQEVASEQIEWLRQAQRQLQERERVKALAHSGEIEEDDKPSNNRTVAQNKIREREQEREQVRTLTQTQSSEGSVGGSGSSGQGGSGRR